MAWIALAAAWGGCAQVSEWDDPARNLFRGIIHNPTFSADGKRLLTGSYEGNVGQIWDLETGREMLRFSGHTESVNAVAFSPDEKRVLTGAGTGGDMGVVSTDNSARLWDAGSGRELFRFAGHEFEILVVQFSFDGSRILTADGGGIIRVWELKTGRLLHVFSGMDNPHHGVTFSPDGRRITALVHRAAVTWATDDGRKVWESKVEGSRLGFNSIEYSPDGRRIVTSSSNKEGRIWDAETGKLLRVLGGHESFVLNATFTRDGARVLTASHDATVGVWEAETGNLLRRLKAPGAVQTVVSACDDRRIFARWRSDANYKVIYGVSIWDAESGLEIRRVEGPDTAVMSPDKRRFLVSQAVAVPAALWDAETGSLIREYK